MPKQEAIVVYDLESCVPHGSYDRGARFNDFDEMVTAMRIELDQGRTVIVERALITKEEFDAGLCIEGPDLLATYEQ